MSHLGNLVSFCLIPILLKIDFFDDPFFPKNMVATSDTHFKIQVSEQLAQVFEANIRIRLSYKDSPKELVVTAHGRSISHPKIIS